MDLRRRSPVEGPRRPQEPLRHHHRRDDHHALDPVALEGGAGPAADQELVGRPGARRGEPLGGAAQDHLGGGGGSLARLVLHPARPIQQRDQRHPALLEMRLEGRRHHASLPGAPPQRAHHAARTPPRLRGRDLVQHLVGGGVVALARVPRAARHGGEQQDLLQRIPRGRLEQRPEPLHLRGKHPVKLLHGLVHQQLVRQHAGPVDQRGDRPEALADNLQRPGHRGRVLHVRRQVEHLGARRLDRRQRLPHLPRGQDLLYLFLDLRWGWPASSGDRLRQKRPGQHQPFQGAPGIFGLLQQRGAPQEGYPGVGGPGQLDQARCGDAPGSAGRHHHRGAVDAEGTPGSLGRLGAHHDARAAGGQAHFALVAALEKLLDERRRDLGRRPPGALDVDGPERRPGPLLGGGLDQPRDAREPGPQPGAPAQPEVTAGILDADEEAALRREGPGGLLQRQEGLPVERHRLVLVAHLPEPAQVDHRPCVVREAVGLRGGEPEGPERRAQLAGDAVSVVAEHVNRPGREEPGGPEAQRCLLAGDHLEARRGRGHSGRCGRLGTIKRDGGPFHLGDDLAEGLEGGHVAGLDRGEVGDPLLHGGEDLDALDGVDAEVRLQRHLHGEHVGRVAGLLRDDLQQRPFEVHAARRGGRGRSHRGRGHRGGGHRGRRRLDRRGGEGHRRGGCRHRGGCGGHHRGWRRDRGWGVRDRGR